MPNFQDEVKHVNSGDVGTVIATYIIEHVKYLDVRLDYDKVKYKTPDIMWETIWEDEDA